MTENGLPPQIFDDAVRDLRRARAARRLAGQDISFLLERCLDDAADRIVDVNRRFKSILTLGPVNISAALLERLPEDKRPQTIEHARRITVDGGPVDMVLSLLDLQSENDLPGVMAQMATRLKPDGLFIAALFGGETLTELRQALYKTDEAVLGGLTARVFPMVTHAQAAPLLGRAGLNLPVVDMDRFTVRYSQLSKLIEDLRDLGETNSLLARSTRPVGKVFLTALEKNYKTLFREKDKYPASFEILWLTGWQPHESQQKPLKPGSAKTRLAAALGAKEQKI